MANRKVLMAEEKRNKELIKELLTTHRFEMARFKQYHKGIDPRN